MVRLLSVGSEGEPPNHSPSQVQGCPVRVCVCVCVCKRTEAIKYEHFQTNNIMDWECGNNGLGMRQQWIGNEAAMDWE